MANLNNTTKYKLEQLLGMSTGYVLNFSNASFQDFILTSVGIDIDDKYPNGSKANRLRALWQQESDVTVVHLSLELLDRWQALKLMDGGIPETEMRIYDQAVDELSALVWSEPAPTADEVAFLDKDFGTINLADIPVPVTFKDVIDQRLTEIDLCLRAKAPLAVIFLCGSTLEGLLFAIAEKNPKHFNQAKAAPSRDGKPKPLGDWSLQNLIDVSRELGLVGEDVAKHAHAVRDFRNYIHPRQQIRENFTPRMVTAEIADKVLKAAIADLTQLGK